MLKLKRKPKETKVLCGNRCVLHVTASGATLTTPAGAYTLKKFNIAALLKDLEGLEWLA